MKVRNSCIRELIAEALGTFVLVVIGCSLTGSMVAFTTSGADGRVAQLIASVGWGLALSSAIHVCGGVSGGHVNPAVTMGMASVGKLPWRKVPYYLIGQFVGAFIGALTTGLVYREALSEKFGSLATAPSSIFGSLPANSISNITCFIDQVVATGLFLLLIQAITDKRNMSVSKGMYPFAIGFTNLAVLVLAFNYNCGAPLNPARDFSPRLASFFMGYGSNPFTDGDYYFWVPVLACPIGGILGSWIYRLCIEMHWPEELEPETGKSRYSLVGSNANHGTTQQNADLITTSC